MGGGKPFVLGLTGSIGMGKSAVSDMFRKLEVPVMDSDKVVHELYAKGGAAVAPVGKAFPGVTVDDAILRSELGKYVLNNEVNMQLLESIVHPLVDAERDKFVAQMAMDNHRLVVLDIPLLYETGADKWVDAVAVASTSNVALQRERVLARAGMTPDKLDAILARQVPDEEKRKRADYTIDTACALAETEAVVGGLVALLSCQPHPSSDITPGF
eukprot:CAMPEP_0198212114 /NCGR_PEP_ID=MMETSP1445-20131203/25528_1 /TAXON_ID=36898 /ORGANISM="Pyramimonas sp., Strain CCMP2087" /LENGTH=213 /DNA_ID=CAMNT_0043886495 /DNA_START=355 /DNA_END=996 /DNA_ORIENTATION=+